MKSWPSRAASGLERRLFSFLERFRAPANGTQTFQTVHPLNLLSNDVHSDRFSRFSENFSQSFSQDAKTLLSEADQNSFLGKETEIPWHQDIVSGFSWDPKTFFADIHYGDRKGVDIKDPWDRSRCQHLVRLGQAYALTKDEKYARSFVLQIQDWIQKNRRGRGVNWVSPMEIAVRAGNWLLGWEFFHRSPSIPSDFQALFAHSLNDHGTHIAHRIEHGGRHGTNHYVANLMGLAYVGAALDRSEWRRMAEQGLEREIQSQTFSDGMSYEASTAYHRLVTEMFFYFGLLSPRSAGYSRRLAAMVECLARLMDSRGRVPLIGDNDSGRFHSLFPRDDADMTYLIELWKGSATTSEGAWFFGPTPQKTNQLSSPILPASSGLIALRPPNHVLVVSAQPNGAGGVGHHTHNDKLSFTLSIEGQPFFIDPGTVAYTSDPELRNRFRSTEMHSTVVVDAEEQNRFSGSLFELQNDARVTVLEHKPDERVIARHTGYERLAEPVLHERRIEWREGMWVIEDKFTGRGEHDFLWNFILADGVTIQMAENKKIILASGPVLIDFRMDGSAADFLVEDTDYAPAYRKRLPTKKIVLRGRRVPPFAVTFFLHTHP